MTKDKIGFYYRPCVGLVVLNHQGKAFMGKRGDIVANDQEVFPWQFPQGGIDKGETVCEAGWRELAEETGLTQGRIIGLVPEWLTYDLPNNLIGAVLNRRFKGQRQLWLAMAMTEPDSAVRIDGSLTNTKAEFIDWEWVDLDEAPKRIIAFKRDIYSAICEAFKPLAQALAEGQSLPTLDDNHPSLLEVPKPQ